MMRGLIATAALGAATLLLAGCNETKAPVANDTVTTVEETANAVDEGDAADNAALAPANDRGSDDRGSDDRGSDDRGSDDRGSDDRGSEDR